MNMEKLVSDRPHDLNFRAARGDFHWDGVETRRYKDEPLAPYRDVTRQVLFSDPSLRGELRYFEVAPGGYSTLERHEHMHAVLVLRGSGQCLVGDEIRTIGLHDLITAPPWAWHQFRAGDREPLGFLCLVNAERDRPQLPSESELAELKRNPAVRAFLEGRIALHRA
jgi:mannose-6-phosphate isomerase-like protein (cupin superfamily)